MDRPTCCSQRPETPVQASVPGASRCLQCDAASRMWFSSEPPFNQWDDDDTARHTMFIMRRKKHSSSSGKAIFFFPQALTSEKTSGKWNSACEALDEPWEHQVLEAPRR